MYLGFRVDYTLHVLDSMFIVTLCSSSIIIYVLIIIRNTSFARTCSPSTTPITLLCVFTFDLANPLHVTPKMCHFTTRSVARPGQSIAKNERLRKCCNFTSRSVTRPGQSIVKIERHALVTPKVCHFTTRSVAFSPSTRPIHYKNRGAERFDKMCNFTSRSVPRPRQSIVKIDALRLTLWKCVILPRVFASDLANPWEGLLRHAKKSETCVILPSVFDFDLSNPWEGLRVMPTMCHFTRRLDARPGQSMVRVAFPTEASELAPALERMFKL